MCYKGYSLFTCQLVTSSTNHKGYLAFHSPPYGGGARGRGYYFSHILLPSLWGRRKGEGLLFPLPHQFVCSAASTLATFLQYILFDKVV